MKRLRIWMRALRVHQWAKNLLILTPSIASHRILEGPVLVLDTKAMLSFCLVASAVYLTNDLVDLESDRSHPSKHMRPLASGQITASSAIAVAVILSFGGALAAISVGTPFVEAVGLYLVVTLLYMLVLKKHVLLDIFGLTSLYVIRLVAGHVATLIPYSPWLTSFCMFLFLGLSSLKRATELRAIAGKLDISPGRGYRAEDLAWLVPMGIASCFVSTMVLAQYIDTGMNAAGRLYQRPHWLWLCCPIALYWQCRNWVLLFRGTMHEDPVWGALKEPTTYLCAGLCGLALILAT